MKKLITITSASLLAAALAGVALADGCAGKQAPVVAHDNETKTEADVDGDKEQPLGETVDH